MNCLRRWAKHQWTLQVISQHRGLAPFEKATPDASAREMVDVGQNATTPRPSMYMYMYQ